MFFIALLITCMLDNRNCMAILRPAQTWNSLKEANKKFVHNKSMEKRRKQIATAQTPSAIVLTCSDSRVVPEYIFKQGLGELFVIRIAGNSVDNIVIDSIEYAVKTFKSAIIVVMGHSNCGAVSGALAHLQRNNGKPDVAYGHFGAVLIPIERAILEANINLTDTDAARLANIANIEYSARQLVSRSPRIKAAIEQKTLQIIGAIYYLETGIVTEIPLSLL